ncbi:MAG: MBL fold metallo-hydrolase [Halobacteriota archaeon]
MEVSNAAEDADVFTSNAWLVRGDGAALVDAGSYDGAVDHVEGRVDSLDVVALTHQHGDHVGALDTVLDAFDPRLASYDDHPRRTTAVEDGDEVELAGEEFTVVYTPGHADDHVAYVGDTAAFTGDVVVYEDEAYSGGSFGRTDMAGQSRETLIRSLERLLPYVEDVDVLYPGHGPSFEGDVHAVVDKALERAERREPKYG